IAIAGVMGGQNSEISDGTTNVLIESAYFDPSAIRRTSKFLGLSTDSSYRFERGTDIENTIYAVNRAAQLMHEFAGGEIAEGIIDVYPDKRTPKQVIIRTARVNAVLGAELDIEEMIGACAKLGFTPTKKTDVEFSVTIPTYRPDMELEIDVIEEIARIIGYDRFAPKTPYISMHLPLRSSPPPVDVREKIRNTLVAQGYTEVVTSSLLDEHAAELFSEKLVHLANPLSAEMAVVRPHPLPQVLATIARNIHLGTKDIRIFEISRSYERAENDSIIVEKRFVGKEWLTVAACGATSAAWDSKPRQVDFYDLKGIVEKLFHAGALDKFKFIPYNSVEKSVYTPVSLSVVHGGRTVGSLGNVSPSLLKQYDVDASVCVAMIEIGAMQSGGKRPQYVPPLRFPGIVRDLAIVAPTEKSAQEIGETISRSASSPLLRAVRIFDVFEGGAVGENNRSLAFSLEFAADDRTLRDEEVAEVMSKIMNDLEQRHHFTIRSS
ncbi:MAG TPA: phenylalanine--tRNA ligase subunit beta, partial [Candidatus Kapabacteria bacterium]|nr:phenylalanine--tRNA ligase subunit beta [Candidatus Kapabacteria bacterium]